MNLEELLKTFDPDLKVQKEMYHDFNKIVMGKPVMVSFTIFLNYLADWSEQLSKEDPVSREYIVELIEGFSAHISERSKTGE